MLKPKPSPVTAAMKQAGVKVLAESSGIDAEKLVTEIYQAMEAATAVPLYQTRAIEGLDDDIDDAFIIERPPSGKKRR